VNNALRVPAGCAVIIASVVAFVLAAPGHVRAQIPASPLPIELGQTRTGSLEPGDPAGEDLGRYDDFTFRAEAGQRILILLTSNDFDPVLVVGRPDPAGGLVELSRNDDGGGGVDSLMVFHAPHTGVFVDGSRGRHGAGSGSTAFQRRSRRQTRFRPVSPDPRCFRDGGLDCERSRSIPARCGAARTN